jgi:hypothetical protein
MFVSFVLDAKRFGVSVLGAQIEGRRSRKAPKTVNLRLVARPYLGVCSVKVKARGMFFDTIGLSKILPVQFRPRSPIFARLDSFADYFATTWEMNVGAAAPVSAHLRRAI